MTDSLLHFWGKIVCFVCFPGNLCPQYVRQLTIWFLHRFGFPLTPLLPFNLQHVDFCQGEPFQKCTFFCRKYRCRRLLCSLSTTNQAMSVCNLKSWSGQFDANFSALQCTCVYNNRVWIFFVCAVQLFNTVSPVWPHGSDICSTAVCGLQRTAPVTPYVSTDRWTRGSANGQGWP